MEQRLSFDAYQLHGDFIVPSWLVWGIGFKKLLFLLKTPPENLRKLIQNGKTISKGKPDHLPNHPFFPGFFELLLGKKGEL